MVAVCGGGVGSRSGLRKLSRRWEKLGSIPLRAPTTRPRRYAGEWRSYSWKGAAWRLSFGHDIRTGTPPEPDFVEDTKSNPQIEYEVVSMEVSQKALCSSGDRYYHAELGGWKEEGMDAMGEALVDKGP